MPGTSLGHPPTRPPPGPPLPHRLSLKDDKRFDNDAPVLLQGGSIDGDFPVVFEGGMAESVFRPPLPIPNTVFTHGGSASVVRAPSPSIGFPKERPSYSPSQTPPEAGCDNRIGYLMMEDRSKISGISPSHGASLSNPSSSLAIPIRSTSKNADYEYAMPQRATYSASNPVLSTSLPRLKAGSILEFSPPVPTRPPPLPPHTPIAPPLSPSHFWSAAYGDEEYDMPTAPWDGMTRRGLQSPPPPPQHVSVPEGGSPKTQCSDLRKIRPSVKRAEIHPVPTGVAYAAPQTFKSGLRNSLKKNSDKLPLMHRSASISDNEDSWDQPLPPPPPVPILPPHEISNFDAEHTHSVGLERNRGTVAAAPTHSSHTRGSKPDYGFHQAFSHRESANRTSVARPIIPRSREQEMVIPPPPQHVPIPEDKSPLDQSDSFKAFASVKRVPPLPAQPDYDTPSAVSSPPGPQVPKIPSEPELGPARPPKSMWGSKDDINFSKSATQISPVGVRSPCLSRKNSSEKVSEGSMSPRLSWGHRRVFSSSGQGKGPEIGKVAMERTPSMEAVNRESDAAGRRGSAGSQSIEKKPSGLRRIMSLNSRGLGSSGIDLNLGNSNNQSPATKTGRLSGSGADLPSPSCVLEETHYTEISPPSVTLQTNLGGYQAAGNSVAESHSGKGKKRDKIKAMLKSIPHHHHRRDAETDRDQWWYHAELSRMEAEGKIKGKPQGTFLVRPSSAGDSYSLSIVTPTGEVIHLLIGVEGDGALRLGGDACVFASLTELVKHYKKNKLVVNGLLDTVLRKQTTDYYR